MSDNEQLARLLDGVASDPNPGRQFLQNCAEELDPEDVLSAWELAGFLLDNRDVIYCALVGRRQ
jgi:hypothetical protein